MESCNCVIARHMELTTPTDNLLAVKVLETVCGRAEAFKKTERILLAA